MQMNAEDQAALEELQLRVRAILPELYHDGCDDVKPVSMGTAALRFDSGGNVAWDEMWGSFCDLALAGGPPHKGTLLEPASKEAIESEPDRYRTVVQEICRGIEMVANVPAEFSQVPGWISVDCVNYTTARWLLRAIVMENVSARCEGSVLNLPSGPWYRLEKEIKNVITVIAKTSHHWFGHTSLAQRRNIGNLFTAMEEESSLLQPAFSSRDFQPEHGQTVRNRMAKTLNLVTGLRASSHEYLGWLGIESTDINSAIWMMRAMVASNVLSRREGTVFFVPIDPFHDPNGAIVVRLVKRLHGFAQTLRVQ
jgi:sirohydrochlorin cobaltochelatase